MQKSRRQKDPTHSTEGPLEWEAVEQVPGGWESGPRQVDPCEVT